MSRLSLAWHMAFAAAAITACLLLSSALDSPLTAGLAGHLRGIAIGIGLRGAP